MACELEDSIRTDLSVTKESQKTVASAFLLLGYLRFGNVSLVRMVKACFPFFKAMI